MRNDVFENPSAAMEAGSKGVDQKLPNEGSGASNEQCSEEILSLQDFNDLLL